MNYYDMDDYKVMFSAMKYITDENRLIPGGILATQSGFFNHFEGARVYDDPENECVYELKPVTLVGGERAIEVRSITYDQILRTITHCDEDCWMEDLRGRETDGRDRMQLAGRFDFESEVCTIEEKIAFAYLWCEKPYLPATPKNFLALAAKGEYWEILIKNIEEATGGIFVKRFDENN